MAMLAEPRQRKRYNLTPRGKPLYNDSDRFGTKMLEKMGWSKGKGLGANEDGSQDFVRVQYKNDFRGMGYEDRDDHWTQHEQSFSALLDNLNDKGEQRGKNDANGSDDEMAPRIGFGFVDSAATKEEGKKLKEKFSGESLEEKSKRSRARVHYKKFTRGKDLAQYSEKDLANIFGRKESDALQYPQLEAFNANDEPEEESKEEENAEETKQVEHFSGVTTISTGLSLNDYFKQKMEALKKRKMQNGEQTTANRTEEAVVNGHSDGQEEVPKKKKKKCKECVEVNGVEPEEACEPTKKEKKKKKAKESEPIEITENPEEEAIPKKKKKKNKDSSKDQEQSADTQEKEKAAEVIEEQPPKKKKSKKNKENVEEIAKEEPQVEADIVEEAAKKKKSKKEKREEIQETVAVTVEEESSKKAKKKKAKEGESVIQQDIEEIPKKKNKDKGEGEELESVTSQESQKKSKKNKKNKEEIEAETITLSEEEEEKPKKKKKDKKKAQETNEQERSDANEAAEEIAAGEGVARKAKKKPKESGVDSPEESEGSVAEEQAAPPPPPNAVSELADDDDPHGPAPLEKARQSDNVHIINTFHAELFRFADLPQFDGSNIGDVVGYAMHDQMELQIQENPRRDNDVATLWMSCAQSKYDVELRRKRRAKQYTTDVRKLKRKQVFLGI